MVDVRVERRRARIEEIVAAAWRLARTHGIGGFSLHALARELDIRQPSLYAYFDSKNALYDAMFAAGNRELLARLDALRLPADPRVAVKRFMRAFTDFAVEDPARAALLFQRVVPGFEPSADSYALAQEVLVRAVGLLPPAGIETQAGIDCFVAMIGGLIEAQLSNEPEGNRWTRHLDRMIDMHLDDAERRRAR